MRNIKNLSSLQQRACGESSPCANSGQGIPARRRSGSFCRVYPSGREKNLERAVESVISGFRSGRILANSAAARGEGSLPHEMAGAVVPKCKVLAGDQLRRVSAEVAGAQNLLGFLKGRPRADWAESRASANGYFFPMQ